MVEGMMLIVMKKNIFPTEIHREIELHRDNLRGSQNLSGSLWHL